MRSVMCGLVVLLLGAGAARAEVVKGTVKKVDAEKGELTVTVKDKDRTFTVPDGAKVTIQVAAGSIEPKGRLKNTWFKRAVEGKGGGYRVEVTTETKDKKEVVTKVHLFTPTRREGPGGPGAGPSSQVGR